MNELNELHSWVMRVELEYQFCLVEEEAIRLRKKAIKLRRIYNRMRENWLKRINKKILDQ
jgi:hypothetical protein